MSESFLCTFVIAKSVRMKISTRGRYALRVLIDLAEQYGKGYIALKELSERESISLKYLEAIMTLLSKHKFVDAVHGKGGGYKLNKSPEEYKVSDILTLTEGSLAPVACLDCTSAHTCERTNTCPTLPMWTRLEVLITNYLSGISLADLIQK